MRKQSPSEELVMQKGIVIKNLTKVTAGLMITAMLAWGINVIQFSSWDFRNNLWAPASLIWRHQSAYAIGVLFPDGNAIWFPQIIGVFFPLGLLSLSQATNIWLLVNLGLLVLLIWVLAFNPTRKKPSLWLFASLLVAVFTCPITIRHLILGQADIILMAAMLLGAFAFTRRQFGLSGLCFAIALSKPQLCLLVLPSLLGSAWLQKEQRRGVILSVFYLCAFSLALTAPLWIANQNWGSDFLSNTFRNPQWAQPNLYAILGTSFGMYGFIMWAALFLLALVISLRLGRKWEPTRAVSWSLAFTTLVSPYIWSWDFVLLLPLVINTAARLTQPASRVMLGVSWIISFVLSVVALRTPSATGDQVLWWFPFVIMAGIAAALLLETRTQKN
jgi:hypothetical protein